jgi:hypothetical protein
MVRRARRHQSVTAACIHQLKSRGRLRGLSHESLIFCVSVHILEELPDEDRHGKSAHSSSDQCAFSVTLVVNEEVTDVATGQYATHDQRSEAQILCHCSRATEE